MKIISLDSSTECASCAVIEDERILGEISFNYKKVHSIILMPMIDYLLNTLGLTINSIDGFAVSKGPGSFTGLRIGASTIKGLSHGTGKPLIGVSSLDALAYNMAYSNGIICPVLDALRNNVYCGIYAFDNQNLMPKNNPSLMPIDELINIIKTENKNNPVCFIGDAVPKFKDKIAGSLHNVSFAPPNLNFVNASSLGILGIRMLKKGIHDNLYSFCPDYLRKSQAEREYEKRTGNTIE